MILPWLLSVAVAMIGPASTRVDAADPVTAVSSAFTLTAVHVGSMHPIPITMTATQATSQATQTIPTKSQSASPQKPQKPVSEASSTFAPLLSAAGWPSSLKIEIGELEVGGLALPLIHNLLQNSKTGYTNYGNIDLVRLPVVA